MSDRPLSMMELSHDFIQQLPQSILEHHVRSDEERQGENTFTPEAVEAIADELQEFVAWVIGTLIDAGSERDAVMEDDNLNKALRETLAGW